MEEVNAYATTQETESVYTKAEVARAKQAYELVKNSRYPSVTELISLVENGKVLNIPGTKHADIRHV